MLWEQVYYYNALRDWLLFCGVALLTAAAVGLAKSVVVRSLRRFAPEGGTSLHDLALDLLRQVRAFFVWALAIYTGTLLLTLPPPATRVVQVAIVLAALLQAGIWGTAVMVFLVSRAVKHRLDQDAASAATIGVLGFVGKLGLWTIVVLLALGNLGVNITALVAGLGVGGIAVALATQNVLGDLFASFSIVLDKPFVMGDFIAVDEHLGTVEHIGLKTTRIRSLHGEQVVFSNTDLLRSRIRNYKRMEERRIVFTLGVTYETAHETLRRIPSLLKAAVEAQEGARFDRAHFREYGDFALLFEVVYYVASPDYAVYMDTQQAINLEIYRQFDEAGIEFAYPTQKVYVDQRGPAAAASRPLSDVRS